jgi:hypothetical protein
MASLPRKLAISVALILCFVPFARGVRRQTDFSAQGYDMPMPPEVLSAKTVALLVKIVDKPGSEVAEEYRKRIEASAVAEIQKRGRFQLVSDPTKADLVCMLMEFSYDYWHEAHSGGKGIRERWRGLTWNVLPPEAIIVFKGGNDTHRTARPVWMETRIMGIRGAWAKDRGDKTPAWMMKDFHSAFVKAEKKEKTKTKPSNDQDSKEEAPETGVMGSTAPPESGTLPAFCLLKQPCYLPRELLSARTVIVCDPIFSCNEKKMKEDVAWGKRWQSVDEPDKADLILILCRTPSNSLDQSMFFYSALFVFKGGEQPGWDTMPLYLQFGHDHDLTLKDFESMIAETARDTPTAGSR